MFGPLLTGVWFVFAGLCLIVFFSEALSMNLVETTGRQSDRQSSQLRKIPMGYFHVKTVCDMSYNSKKLFHFKGGIVIQISMSRRMVAEMRCEKNANRELVEWCVSNNTRDPSCRVWLLGQIPAGAAFGDGKLDISLESTAFDESA